MSLYGSMFSGVSGMNSQGSEANSTFVNSSSSSTSYYSGGEAKENSLLYSTGIVEGLEVSGHGMFVVGKSEDGTGEYDYTRAGSFASDKRGNFVNKAGYYLMGWQLESENRLPGEVGNLDTTLSALLDSLSVVSTRRDDSEFNLEACEIDSDGFVFLKFTDLPSRKMSKAFVGFSCDELKLFYESNADATESQILADGDSLFIE